MALKVFLTGATGYIGGTVLNLMLKQPGKYAITALVRSKAAGNTLKAMNVTPLYGSLDDTDLLTKAAEEADVVIDMADADHLAAAKALITGLSKAPKPKVFIHTSGTGALGDESKGDYTSDFIFSDLDLKSINAIPLTKPHRDVDQYILENCSNVNSIIVCPPTIYGLGTGPVHRQSVQIPWMIKACMKVGFPGTVGKGLNVWNNVHVEDLADFYVLLLEKAVEGKASYGKDGWYFAESSQHCLKDLMHKIGDVMYAKKLIKDHTVRTLTPEQAEQCYSFYAYDGIGCNSRCKAERSRALGWKPKRGDILGSIEAEVNYMVAQKLI